MSSLIQALQKHPSLHTLDLRVCKLGPSGAEVLADALRLTPSLRGLYLWDNELGAWMDRLSLHTHPQPWPPKLNSTPNPNPNPNLTLMLNPNQP